MTDSGALAAPLDGLVSNWAYMTIASLAWTLKTWSGMMIRVVEDPEQKEELQAVGKRVMTKESKRLTSCAACKCAKRHQNQRDALLALAG